MIQYTLTASNSDWYTPNYLITKYSNTASVILYESSDISNNDMQTCTSGAVYYTTITDSSQVYRPPIIKDRYSRLRDIIRSRMSPYIQSKSTPIGHAKNEAEIKARETVRRILGEVKYREYIKKGFVTLRKGIKTYVIKPGHGITEMYINGELKKRLCLVLQGDFPPTDYFIMRYLILENNEELFLHKSIEHPVYNSSRNYTPRSKYDGSLINIWKNIRAA